MAATGFKRPAQGDELFYIAKARASYPDDFAELSRLWPEGAGLEMCRGRQFGIDRNQIILSVYGGDICQVAANPLRRFRAPQKEAGHGSPGEIGSRVLRTGIVFS
ncbi:hypothetical protein GCM10007880_39300 [Mesorhizobium amorphae]|nr:hypothetical protein GCM10007880_39300 [Mesorhizobium amorphae]